ncbi:hypothetical protein [Tessaracoccus sp. OH4464_COT-324]|uniref:hypothetical protein n=1 Tax=Tessaracoccus sp. OH4464_COT-324 TaxID=2491059 RepID=UPI000F64417E|nr:hypothetical protein [Tessaracoccus sp. OH4464_COT-324]RRD46837.1 hypothetical protein EII42_05225 [Tessaracoccus sp. OH4464_COT-324]
MNQKIQYGVRYFREHQLHWYQTSGKLHGATSLARAAKAPASGLWTTLVPGFQKAHDDIAKMITDDLLAKGATSTREIGEKLEEVARAYAAAEAENEQIANQILKEEGYE